MPTDDSPDRPDEPSQQQRVAPKETDPNADPSDSDSGSDSDSDYDSDYSYDEDEGAAAAAGGADSGAGGDEVLASLRASGDEPGKAENTPEANLRRFSEILGSRRLRRLQEEEDRNQVPHEDLFNFPEDPENWQEEDLQELWADAPLESTKPGWDPAWADEEDWDIVREQIKAGREPTIAPFYLPYRKPYPAIPDDHYDISNPKAVVEELDRIEEFLRWVSYIFPDGSSYEGTVWDDLAHGKGVYVAEMGLVRYEGEWLQNNMEGHGVLEVDIPDIQPIPGSKLEEKMRAEGKIIETDYMTPEDREWLKMDIEDSVRLTDGNYQVPFYENDEWIRQFGQKPEKGRYRYAGQWKHGRMHGCGVYEVNERTIYGRFYFGELLQDEYGCNEDVSALHYGIAEVAAAKARMFTNKPDGMVREERGPYGDPQHPYFYEEEDVWMAPGFINQFYEVPDYWKTYVGEVDQEREMWLNSFYKSPLRLPMPAELEYWWSKDHTPEFVLINKEPEPDPQDPSKLIYTEDPLILHTPTGRIINYVEDEEHGIRLFWQPDVKDGEDFDPEKVEFLPLGFDEFYGKEEVVEKESLLKRIIMAMENACKPTFDRLEKWTEEKKKTGEMKIKLIKKELDLIEAELCLEEAIEDMDEELKMREKEEENIEVGLREEVEVDSSVSAKKDGKTLAADEEKEAEEVEEEEEEDESEDEDDEPSSFGSVAVDQDSSKNDKKGSKPGGSPFSTSSLGFASCGLVSVVSSKLQHSFLSWKESRSSVKATPALQIPASSSLNQVPHNLSYTPNLCKEGRLRARRQEHQKHQARRPSKGSVAQLHSLSRILSPGPASRKSKMNVKEPRRWRHAWLHDAPKDDLSSVLSLHYSLYYSESYMDSSMK
ncbi:protein TIC 100 [Eucalyptus grandis]|uniref:protein TIC 100 n=1 Tax=Eucalyptus grandis TaxID=71139 RepID=UPI00192EA046|nr:protein TIC 100 [Eucalyptus grandis]